MYRLCVYLNVNEAWMMGFDVPMERPKEKNNDIMSDIIVRLRTDEGFTHDQAIYGVTAVGY